MRIFSPTWPGSQVNCDFLSVNPNSLNRLFFVCLFVFPFISTSILLQLVYVWISHKSLSLWVKTTFGPTGKHQVIHNKWILLQMNFSSSVPATSLYVWNSQVLITLLLFSSVLVITTYSISWVACVLKIMKNFLSHLDAVIQINMLFSEFPPKRYFRAPVTRC